mmetsp:Transcript_30500/g.85404  ORF Transcript_30500/g.85404 Transcript_30500/m.85404 type:complete len:208 (-) Transcript_30500:264-887(-)
MGAGSSGGSRSFAQPPFPTKLGRDVIICLLDLHRVPFLALALVLHVRGPQREVVPQELHDQRAVLVRVFPESVQLRDGLVEGVLGQVARPLRGVEDLVVEHGEVQGQAQANRVRRRQLVQRDRLGLLVGHQGLLGSLFPVVAGLELGQVAVVVPLHLQVEDLALPALGVGDEVRVQQGQDAVADVAQLLLDHRTVGLDPLGVVGVPL